MGPHTGAPLLTEEGYVGIDLHRAARIAAAGLGGQVLLSHATRDLVEADVRDLGEHPLIGGLDTATIGILGMGLVACERDPARGATLVAAAGALVAEAGGGLQEFEAVLHEQALARARTALGDVAFDRAVSAGRDLSLDAAIAAARTAA
jgi:hypothetical protein